MGDSPYYYYECQLWSMSLKGQVATTVVFEESQY